MDISSEERQKASGKTQGTVAIFNTKIEVPLPHNGSNNGWGKK